MRRTLMLAVIATAWAGPALAADVLEGDIQLGPASMIQSGRLARNNVAGQDFAGSETYPGAINPTTPYHYAAIDVTFAPNALQDVYYLFSFDDDATDLFASAYNGRYDPIDLSRNWVGDAGRSGNYIFFPGLPGDELSFGVKVPQGGSLTFVVNDTVAGLGTSSSAHYLIQAFSDVDYDEDFLTPSVPEPGTWAMMLLGAGLIGASLRYRRKNTKATIAST